MKKIIVSMKFIPTEVSRRLERHELQRRASFVEGRKLEMDERPLWIQLYWGKDQREGRFVLQNAKLPKVRDDVKATFDSIFCLVDVEAPGW